MSAYLAKKAAAESAMKHGHPAPATAVFVITGRAEPDLLARVIAPVAALGAVPLRVHATRESGDGSELTIDLRLKDLPAGLVRQVDEALRAIRGVRQVFAVTDPPQGQT